MCHVVLPGGVALVGRHRAPEETLAVAAWADALHQECSKSGLRRNMALARRLFQQLEPQCFVFLYAVTIKGGGPQLRL